MSTKFFSVLAKTAVLAGVGIMTASCGHDAPMPMRPEAQANVDRSSPQMRTVLDAYKSLQPRQITMLSPQDARNEPTMTDAAKKVMADQHIAGPEPVGGIGGVSIAGPGGPIATRVYYPQGNGPFPALVYFHGGGWVLGNLDTYDASCRALTNDANCVVISVDYRLAPEHRFPAAPEDCYAATQYVMSHPSDFKIDPKHVAVGGESAGGNLAAAVCLMSRDRGMPIPIYQLLIYPVTAATFDGQSYTEFADAVPLNKSMMTWFFGNYLASSSDASNPYVSILRADVSKMPPATIITAQIDPLRSEGEAFKAKLSGAGIPVSYMNYDGVTHEFFGLGAIVDQARQAERFAAQGLQSAFAK